MKIDMAFQKVFFFQNATILIGEMSNLINQTFFNL